ncbi:DUF2939 domain-containing protein [Thermochromatium tepidum]|uniref:DUF2939 domain-containing protein n=1 Tax=Thermochromatium tepidum ATCC 43061 TaxID=316276 RepID=A0A6I6E315_THETI|nr:DUF2939 domain-containing protein [Thermochromatium tepidum]QGU32122.1 DUF2939 domain-containing protein [Thermochromatium tepidum ATCC 43061]
MPETTAPRPTLVLSGHRSHWSWLQQIWSRVRLTLTHAAILILVLTLGYGLWPYGTLRRLEHAVLAGDQAKVAALVDLGAVRDEIARRLDKDRSSLIEAVSDSFIDWLEAGIRQHGVAALQRLVTLDWVREQFLLIPTLQGPGIWASISEIFFSAPDDLRIRIERAPLASPLNLRLQLKGLAWQVTLMYD